MTDNLFDIPEQLSPRLAWMKKHDIRINKDDNRDDKRIWRACGEDQDDDTFEGYGSTEDEAIVDIAKKLHLKLWNEE